MCIFISLTCIAWSASLCGAQPLPIRIELGAPSHYYDLVYDAQGNLDTVIEYSGQDPDRFKTIYSDFAIRRRNDHIYNPYRLPIEVTTLIPSSIEWEYIGSDRFHYLHMLWTFGYDPTGYITSRDFQSWNAYSSGNNEVGYTVYFYDHSKEFYAGSRAHHTSSDGWKEYTLDTMHVVHDSKGEIIAAQRILTATSDSLNFDTLRDPLQTFSYSASGDLNEVIIHGQAYPADSLRPYTRYALTRADSQVYAPSPYHRDFGILRHPEERIKSIVISDWDTVRDKWSTPRETYEYLLDSNGRVGVIRTLDDTTVFQYDPEGFWTERMTYRGSVKHPYGTRRYKVLNSNGSIKEVIQSSVDYDWNAEKLTEADSGVAFRYYYPVSKVKHGGGGLKTTASAFPNPATSSITIQNVERIERLSISDAVGRLLVEASPTSDRHSVSLADFSPGVYTYRILTNGGAQFGRFIKVAP